MYPARSRSLWLATSASAGASRRVGMKSFDQRCIDSVGPSSVQERVWRKSGLERQAFILAFSPPRRTGPSVSVRFHDRNSALMFAEGQTWEGVQRSLDGIA